MLWLDLPSPLLSDLGEVGQGLQQRVGPCPRWLRSTQWAISPPVDGAPAGGTMRPASQVVGEEADAGEATVTVLDRTE
jgi:hypothetical protein